MFNKSIVVHRVEKTLKSVTPLICAGNDLQTEAPIKNIFVKEKYEEEEDLIEKKRKSERGSEKEGRRKAGIDRRESLKTDT